jgi:rubrerythrin
MVGRRDVITSALQAAVILALRPPRGVASELTTYPATREIIGRSREAEMQAHRRYAAFAQQAKLDGYPGIAYLFTALAAAELIHGQNFEKILTGLGVELTPVAAREIQVGSTQQNLIKAAADELDSVYTFYPDILRQLKPEGLKDAVTMTTYAWDTEKQHLKILKSIQRWTPKHFEAVARSIENETGQYFVCQVCGATMVKMPRGKCPVCKFPADNLHKVEPPV